MHTYCQILCFYLNRLLSNGWKQCEWAILMPKLAMRMRRVTWPGGRGSSKTTYQRPQFAYSLYNFYGAITTIKGSLHGSTPIVKRFSAEFLSPVKSGPQNGGFSRITGVNVKFLFSNPEKAHPCAEPRRLTYYAWKSIQGPGLWAVGRTRKKEAE